MHKKATTVAILVSSSLLVAFDLVLKKDIQKMSWIYPAPTLVLLSP
ncbi:hypothetical protein [Caldisalinibacter kiritimatiensis]|uniref:Uncharacterized protein n=1 Tax=Caldisalinibacter kiritimatiensis TaxID=1304284 RepID=R1AWW1_9FIRM|nr:hypothetical protein [Caldisalinibacter kiritimatiensis]EOD01688.1 hypothetical protein L21TH_0229 [Caldisalinibacter kiritimatiensis]